MKKLLVLLFISQAAWARIEITTVDIYSIPENLISESEIKTGVSVMQKKSFLNILSKKLILPTLVISCESVEPCPFAITDDTVYPSEIINIKNGSATTTSLIPGHFIVGYNGTVNKVKNNIYKVKYDYSYLKEIKEIKNDLGTIQAPNVIRESFELSIPLNSNQVWINKEKNNNTSSLIVISTEFSK